MQSTKPYSKTILKGDRQQRCFSGEETQEVALPLGGIGTGCVSINGFGGFQDFALFNRPRTTSTYGAATPESAFACLHIKGKQPITKLVEGPLPSTTIFKQGMNTHGHITAGINGVPRFRKSTFKGEFPFAYLDLSDRDMPLQATISAFNPFIPLDSKNSGIPCAIMEYTFKNHSSKNVDFDFSFHMSNLAAAGGPWSGTRNQVMPNKGVFFYNKEHKHSDRFGSASLSLIGHQAKVKGMWIRGGWFDTLSALWEEVSNGQFKSNAGSKGYKDKDLVGKNGGSLLCSARLKPKESITFPILITWYFPNSHMSIGLTDDGNRANCCDAPYECGPQKPLWQPYYATEWKDAREVCDYVHKHYRSLKERTESFRKALFSSSVPAYVLDAISANLGIIKSPTVLRLDNGHLWGWEGCYANDGCCFGSCTHVWNYAQSIPHLFPELERTLRIQEYHHSMKKSGHTSFRAALPEGAATWKKDAAADGQLGGIMKSYREWQISGDRDWLKDLYPYLKRSLDYCIKIWDPKGEGVLIEPHHNTYDIEFWGADGMCSSIYIGALCAMNEMASALEKNKDADHYQGLAEKGAQYLDQKLFNKKYYIQKVEYKKTKDQSFLKELKKADPKSEMTKLLKKEGPKYQYGQGCLSDGVIGAWMARLYGIETPLKTANVRKHLKSIFEYNFKRDMSDHACTQRPGYALGQEAGLLLCSWPQGGKPTLPFVYSDEVWTGIEYQVASHMIEEGLVDEGLTVVKAVRDRYDGKVRNPWNEYECGNYYARAMASYALLPSLSGFRYSAVDHCLQLAPKLKAKDFSTFFSTASAFGTLKLSNKQLTINVIEGELKVEQLKIEIGNKNLNFECDLQATPDRKATFKF